MNDSTASPTGRRAYRLPVSGMTCGACERHVERALRQAGAAAVTADFHQGEARFSAPAELDAGRFVAAIAATPYRAGQPEALDVREGAPQPTHRQADTTFDLAIVGSGAAAFAAAIHATEQGARVVMIERGTLGGTCVNVGCIPSKTQLRAAEHFWQAGHHGFAGISTAATDVDLATLVDRKNTLVSQLRAEKYADLIAQYGWELVRGQAEFTAATTLRAGDLTIRANAYIIASGARPAEPDIPGLANVDYLTSTSLLDLNEVPRELLVIGAGYVGLELGQLFHRLGSRVTLLQRGAALLRDAEPEVSAALHEILTIEGLNIATGASILRVGRAGRRVRLEIEVGGSRRTLEGDAVLVATGRTPNTVELNLGTGHVAVGERGEVVVDGLLRTSNPRVFAAGDVTLGPQYVYVAARQGAIAAENALGGQRLVDLRAVPGVIFTSPAVATVGLTAVEARLAGRTPKSSVLPLQAVPRALVNRDARGLIKLVADAETNEVLGVHIVAENAGDVIYAGVLAVKHRLTVGDLAESFAPYLTMSEGLKLAAQSFDRDIKNLSCCAA